MTSITMRFPTSATIAPSSSAAVACTRFNEPVAHYQWRCGPPPPGSGESCLAADELADGCVNHFDQRSTGGLAAVAFGTDEVLACAGAVIWSRRGSRSQNK